MKSFLPKVFLTTLVLSTVLAGATLKFDSEGFVPDRRLITSDCGDATIKSLSDTFELKVGGKDGNTPQKGTCGVDSDTKKLYIDNGACRIDVDISGKGVTFTLRTVTGSEVLKLDNYNLDGTKGDGDKIIQSKDFELVTKVYIKSFIDACSSFKSGEQLKILADTNIKAIFTNIKPDKDSLLYTPDNEDQPIRITIKPNEGTNKVNAAMAGYSINFKSSYFNVTNEVLPRKEEEIKSILQTMLVSHKTLFAMQSNYYRNNSSDMVKYEPKNFQDVAKIIDDATQGKFEVVKFSSECKALGTAFIECKVTGKKGDTVVMEETGVYLATSMYSMPHAFGDLYFSCMLVMWPANNPEGTKILPDPSAKFLEKKAKDDKKSV